MFCCFFPCSCWLSLEGGLLYAFVGPAAAVVLVRFRNQMSAFNFYMPRKRGKCRFTTAKPVFEKNVQVFVLSLLVVLRIHLDWFDVVCRVSEILTAEMTIFFKYNATRCHSVCGAQSTKKYI